MATEPDPQLRESFQLQRDSALSDPVHVPWVQAGLATLIGLVVILAVLRLNRKKPVPVFLLLPAPVEDTLAALDAAWGRATVDNIPGTITEFAAILRRHLSRLLATD